MSFYKWFVLLALTSSPLLLLPRQQFKLVLNCKWEFENELRASRTFTWPNFGAKWTKRVRAGPGCNCLPGVRRRSDGEEFAPPRNKTCTFNETARRTVPVIWSKHQRACKRAVLRTIDKLHQAMEEMENQSEGMEVHIFYGSRHSSLLTASSPLRACMLNVSRI